jgi:hypothetical protein
VRARRDARAPPHLPIEEHLVCTTRRVRLSDGSLKTE